MIHFGIIFIVLFVVALALLWMILDYQYIRMQTLLKQEHSMIERCIDKVKTKGIQSPSFFQMHFHYINTMNQFHFPDLLEQIAFYLRLNSNKSNLELSSYKNEFFYYK